MICADWRPWSGFIGGIAFAHGPSRFRTRCVGCHKTSSRQDTMSTSVLSFAFTITIVFRLVKFKGIIVLELVNIGSKLSTIVFKPANSGAMPPKSDTTIEIRFCCVQELRAKFGDQRAQQIVEETEGVKIDGVMHWLVKRTKFSWALES